MDAVGFAASILTIVGLVNKVHETISSILDAPHTIQRGCEEVRNLAIALQVLGNSRGAYQTQLKVLLNDCKNEASSLKELVESFQLHGSPQPRRAIRSTWGSIKAVIKKDKIQDLQSSLGRAKASLTLVIG